MAKGKKTGGRVAGEDGVMHNVTVRVSEAQRDRYRQRAKDAGFSSVSEWMRDVLAKELAQPLVMKCGCYSDACYCRQTPPNTDIEWAEDGGH